MRERECREQHGLGITILKELGHDVLERLEPGLLIGIVEDVLDPLARALKAHLTHVGDARHLLDGDAGVEQLLDRGEHAALTWLDEAQRDTLAARAAHAADAVDVDLGR